VKPVLLGSSPVQSGQAHLGHVKSVLLGSSPVQWGQVHLGHVKPVLLGSFPVQWGQIHLRHVKIAVPDSTRPQGSPCAKIAHLASTPNRQTSLAKPRVKTVQPATI